MKIMICDDIFTFIYHQIAPRITHSPVQSPPTVSRNWGAPGAHSEPKLLPKQDTKSTCKEKKNNIKNNWQETSWEGSKGAPAQGAVKVRRSCRGSPGTANRAELPVLMWKANQSCVKGQIKAQPALLSWAKPPHQPWDDGWCFGKELRANESYPGLIIAVFFSQGWRGLPAKSVSVFWLK